jgi:hypothetical protein
MSTIFQPLASTSLGVGTTSARTALPVQASHVRINVDGGKVYLRFGDSTVSATTNDMLISANQPENFRISSATHVAAICQSGSAIVSITSGEGQ